LKAAAKFLEILEDSRTFSIICAQMGYSGILKIAKFQAVFNRKKSHFAVSALDIGQYG